MYIIDIACSIVEMNMPMETKRAGIINNNRFFPYAFSDARDEGTVST